MAGLGFCAAGWLVLTPFAFGYQGRGWHAATLTDLATGGGLAVICVTTLIAWTLAWRRALRADGVLSRPERGPARTRRRRERAGDGQGGGQAAADPEQLLTALRALLSPMLDTPAEEAPPVAPSSPGRAARRRPAGYPATARPGPPSQGPYPPGRRSCPPGRKGIGVIESMLAGAELLMTGRDEEEAW